MEFRKSLYNQRNTFSTQSNANVGNLLSIFHTLLKRNTIRDFVEPEPEPHTEDPIVPYLMLNRNLSTVNKYVMTLHLFLDL